MYVNATCPELQLTEFFSRKYISIIQQIAHMGMYGIYVQIVITNCIYVF